MKSLVDYVKEYSFNENLNESHYTINEGLMDWLKEFWEWLKGDNNKKEFNVWDDNYDEAKKKKYIVQYDSKAIKVQPAKDLDMVKKLVEKEKPEKDKKSIFSKTESIISKLGEDAEKVKWMLFMFNSDDLKECAGILGYLEKSSVNEDAIECVDIDINKLYSSIVDLGFVRDTIIKVVKENSKSAIVFRELEKSVAKEFVDEYSFDLEEIKDKKGYYIHYEKFN